MYTKHSVLSGFEKEKPSKEAIAQIRSWFLGRDYSFKKTIEPTEFAKELEHRLLIIQTLSFQQLVIAPITGLERNYWKHSCQKSITQLSSLSLNLPASKSRLSNLVSLESVNNLTLRQELATAHFNEDIKSQGQDPTQLNHIQLNRRDYLCPIESGQEQVLISIDLAGGSDKKILEAIGELLAKSREELGIPEKTKSQRNNSALNPFINQCALEYLDILIYCMIPESTDLELNQWRTTSVDILTPKHGHIWNLSDTQVADLLGNNNPLIGGEEIKKWRNRFYEPKLLDSSYMQSLLSSVKAEARA